MRRLHTQCTRSNCLPNQEQVSGPLTTQEMREQHTTWTKRAQAKHEQVKMMNVLGCKWMTKDSSCVQADCMGSPSYLPDQHPYTLKVSARVQNANFRNSWFWDVQVKLFNSFLLTKIPPKKSFRCKVIGRWSLLHVNCFNYPLTSSCILE